MQTAFVWINCDDDDGQDKGERATEKNAYRTKPQ